MWIIAILLLSLSIIFLLTNKYKNPYEYSIPYREITIDIQDNEGKIVHYKSSSLLKILKNGTFHYNTFVSTDAGISNVRTNLGEIESEKKENGEYKYKCTLGRKRKKGEKIMYNFEFDWLDSFTDAHEYYAYTQATPGSVVKITILFPEERKPQKHWAEELQGHYKTESKYQPILNIINNRIALELTIPGVGLNDVYYLRWQW